MALFRYFKPVPKSSKLPDPEGPLSQSMPSASIKDANEAYLKAAARSEVSKRGSYVKLTGVQQAQIARYAFTHGNKEAIHYYTKQYCVLEIAESSVSTWKAKYTEEMK